MGGKNAKIQAYGKTVRQQRDKELQNWRKILLKKKVELNISKEKEEIIISSYAHELAELLNQGQTTSTQILTVLALRCTTVCSHYNLITQHDFEVANLAAEQCDEIRKQSGKKNWTFRDEWDPQRYLPPLFGIPTSVKDYFDQKGKRSTLGVTVRAHDIKEKDSGIVACLRVGGIIPFVRSNVAQTTMDWATVNHLFGRSKSIWDESRSVGGSSGGQGALLSAFCTPLGLGTDIGGSLRNPAEFNGVVSLKPCTQRFSTSREYTTDIPDLLYGNDSVKSTLGPMARCVEDLSLWMKTTCDERNHLDKDPYHRHIQFNTEHYLTHSRKKLKIGIIKSYALLQASPASQRAVEEVALFLQKQGHEVVAVNYPRIDQIIGQYETFFLAEGGFKSVDQMLQGEEPVFGLKPAKWMLKSKIFYGIAYFGTKYFIPRLHDSVKKFRTLSTEEYFKHKTRVDKLQKQFVEWWKSLSLDHIITPGFGCQSCPTELCGQLEFALIYTFIWNLLNFSAGALPITTVQEDEQHYQSCHKDLLTKVLRKSAETSQGMPVGIQVIGMPFEEEKVLSLMKSIEDIFQFRKHRKVVQAMNQV